MASKEVKSYNQEMAEQLFNRLRDCLKDYTNGDLKSILVAATNFLATTMADLKDAVEEYDQYKLTLFVVRELVGLDEHYNLGLGDYIDRKEIARTERRVALQHGAKPTLIERIKAIHDDFVEEICKDPES